jgi:heat shock protein HslJ
MKKMTNSGPKIKWASMLVGMLCSAIAFGGTMTGEIRLEDKKWVLETLNGKPVEGTKPFISFDAGKQSAGGDTGCNVFGGSYAVSGDTIRIFDTISTMRACIEDDRMDVERKFMEALQNANRFEIKNGKLLLYRKGKLLVILKGESK